MKNERTNILQFGGFSNTYVYRKATVMAGIPNDMRVDYHHFGNKILYGGGMQLVVKMALEDLSKYKIVHNLTTNPVFLRNRNKIIVMTTAQELQEIQFPELTPLVIDSFKSQIWRQTITIPGIKCLLKSEYANATSLLVKDGLIKAGYPKNQIFLTPLGVSQSLISDKKNQRRSSEKGFRIGTVGTAGPQKNTPFSIAAVRQLEGNDITFEIWGNSIYGRGQLLNMLGGDPRIKLMGYVPESKKTAIYDSFDVFLFPSIFEGFGIPIMEAKARGLPVILLKGGRISPEVKEHCLEAKTPEHMADLIRKIKDNGYDPKLRKKATESARKFTLKRTGQTILNAYRSIISET
jgi:glycosyltransferase involved in cell wall biosynthesis